MEKVKTKGVILSSIKKNKSIILKSILITFFILLIKNNSIFNIKSLNIHKITTRINK